MLPGPLKAALNDSSLGVNMRTGLLQVTRLRPQPILSAWPKSAETSERRRLKLAHITYHLLLPNLTFHPCSFSSAFVLAEGNNAKYVFCACGGSET